MTRVRTAEAVAATPSTDRRRERNQNGQAMGPKGLKTRRRLMDSTVRLLDSLPLRDLRVADIAREAKTSAATFYLYFNDVTEVVLEAAAQSSLIPQPIIDIIDSDWGEGSASKRAHHFVEDYFAFWQSHESLFRVRNLASDEGDMRFRTTREQSIRPLMDAIARRISEAQARGWVDPGIHAYSATGVLLAMLERNAVVVGTTSHAGITKDRQIEATAYLVAQMLGPPKR